MSVHKMRRKTGVGYQVRWRDESGASRAQTFDRRQDAVRFEGETRRLRQLGQLAQLDAGKGTLAEFGETWWELYARPHLAIATKELYAGIWDRHILPELGDHRLRQLTPLVIAKFIAVLHDRGVGNPMILKTLSLLQSVLNKAVLHGEIPTNPVVSVPKPRQRRTREIVVSAPARVERLRGHLDQPDATLVSILAYAGLRPGEALALTWGDVRDRTLYVHRASSYGANKDTKTGRARSVALLSPLADDLQAWRVANGRSATTDLVFPHATGDGWNRSRWDNWRNRTFRPAAELVGLEASRPYDLRHSFASLLIHEGRLSIVEIAAQLGHSPTMCLGTYGHVIAELQDAPRISAAEQIRFARDGAMCTERA